MSQGWNGLVYVDVPPMPNVKVLASTITQAAPANNRAYALGVTDMEGILSMTHNSTATTPSFTFLAWSDVAGWWIPYATQSCAQFNQVTWKAFANTPFYVYSSTALIGGGAIVVFGGATIQGNVPFVAAGV